jgi:Transposase family tnp2
VIPGPKKPCNLDSFLWPLVQELLQLEIGVSAFDAITKAIFLLHAYLIIVFGDIPVVSMIMHMKGHNAISPCHMCTIKGVHIPSLQMMMHYAPLYHNGFPDSWSNMTHLSFLYEIMCYSWNRPRKSSLWVFAVVLDTFRTYHCMARVERKVDY